MVFKSEYSDIIRLAKESYMFGLVFIFPHLGLLQFVSASFTPQSIKKKSELFFFLSKSQDLLDHMTPGTRT